jgi:hypothetical protein
MANFKATPEQWAQMERSQVFNGSFQACVLELRARVEALEGNLTPNDRQIRSSLVGRVSLAICYAQQRNETGSRAAIREVAAWLREHEADYSAVRELEQEAE